VIHFLAGVVEGQGGPHRGFQAEAAQDGLGAVVAGAHGDAFLVEGLAHFLSLEAFQHEGGDAGLVPRRADDAQAGNGFEAVGGVFQQGVLVAGDVFQADAFHVVQGGAQAHGVGDVAGAGFELVGRRLV